MIAAGWAWQPPHALPGRFGRTTPGYGKCSATLVGASALGLPASASGNAPSPAAANAPRCWNGWTERRARRSAAWWPARTKHTGAAIVTTASAPSVRILQREGFRFCRW